LKQKSKLIDVWGELGITKHFGGVYATQQLIELCDIRSGLHVLEIGCGTGYTACLLAKKYDANVAAVDINSKILEVAKKRAVEEGVSDKVKIIEADAEELPLLSNTFDVAIAESVLSLCDSKKVASEMYHILKPNGVFGANEATYLRAPPEELRTFISGSLGGLLLQESEWRAVFKEAGFVNLASRVYPVNSWKQFTSYFKVDGARKIIFAVIRMIFDSTIREVYFKKEAPRVSREFLSYAGYGLYVGKKPHIRNKQEK
jgi:ubiquinone/menaquinone biosynthesis C-methylase UbiE